VLSPLPGVFLTVGRCPDFFGIDGASDRDPEVGTILQSLDAVTWKAIRSTGGFVEGFVYLTRYLHSHTGYGIDDPNNNDITAVPNTLFGRTYNSTFYSNLLWDLGGKKKFRIGFEFTYCQTDYKDPTNLVQQRIRFATPVPVDLLESRAVSNVLVMAGFPVCVKLARVIPLAAQQARS
jgi:hypothetical protein